MIRRGVGKQHKYRAQRTDCGAGHSHPSKAEARRCDELHLLQRAGKISHLEREVAFPFRVDGAVIFTYRADFAYFEDQARVIEDVKGCPTPVYKLKKKLIEAQYRGVKIVEVK